MVRNLVRIPDYHSPIFYKSNQFGYPSVFLVHSIHRNCWELKREDALVKNPLKRIGHFKSNINDPKELNGSLLYLGIITSYLVKYESI